MISNRSIMFQSVENSDDAYLRMNKQGRTKMNQDVIFTLIKVKGSHL